MNIPLTEIFAKMPVDELEQSDVRVHTLERMRRIFALVLVAAQFVLAFCIRRGFKPPVTIAKSAKVDL